MARASTRKTHPPPDQRPISLRPALITLLLAGGTLALFWPAFRFDFVTLDDPDYVSGNAIVQAGVTWQGLLHAFEAGHANNWHPLTWLSHMLDAQLFGPGPAGPHVVNVLLHTLNTLLLFHFLRRATGATWRSAAVAAFFAWHPLHVESVAWIAERKDVLSAFFFLLTLQFWLHYAKQTPERPSFRNRFYWLSLALFALGLMSKPMVVTLPFVLMLLDYWPLQRGTPNASARHRFLPLLLEKIPFFILSAGASVLTVVAQREGAVQSLEQFPFPLRLANAAVACVRYVRKMFWPTDLAVFYPYPPHWPATHWIGAALLLGIITFLAIRFARRFPFLPLGWFWFLGMLVPVIGLVQVGEQSMADRYTYLPLIGIFVIVAWGAAEISKRTGGMSHGFRIVSITLAVAGLILCAHRTRVQLAFWAESEALYLRALAVTDQNRPACKNLANYLLSRGRVAESIAWNERALEMKPDDPETHNNLGTAFAVSGRLADAIRHYEEALRLQPGSAQALNNLGYALHAVGRRDEAIVSYRKSLAIEPNSATCRYNLGLALAAAGLNGEAIEMYLSSLALNPRQPKVRFHLSRALLAADRRSEAISQLRQALQLHPDYTDAAQLLAELERTPP